MSFQNVSSFTKRQILKATERLLLVLHKFKVWIDGWMDGCCRTENATQLNNNSLTLETMAKYYYSLSPRKVEISSEMENNATNVCVCVCVCVWMGGREKGRKEGRDG
jgi:hypothetical protein